MSSSLPPAFRACSRRGADWVFWTVQYTTNRKKVVSGERVVPSATVANPEALGAYSKYQGTERFAELTCRRTIRALGNQKIPVNETEGW